MRDLGLGHEECRSMWGAGESDDLSATWTPDETTSLA